MRRSITIYVSCACALLVIAAADLPLSRERLHAEAAGPPGRPAEPTVPPSPPSQPRVVSSPILPDGVPGSLSVLALNLHGTMSSKGTSWETRVDRIAAWARRRAVAPDVIVLQEVFGWADAHLRSCGEGFMADTGDYDQIDRLLHGLSAATGIVYRIAYLTGTSGERGDLPYPFSCEFYHAQAMLYNPARLVNLTASESAYAAPHDTKDGVYNTVHLRKSLPLCERGTWLMPLVRLIDGPTQTDKCGRPTPSGPAWAVFRKGAHIAGSFVRFAFVEDSSRAIDIFNLHPVAGEEASDKALIQGLIARMERPPYAESPLYYPPILAGDFNGLPAAELGPYVTLTHPPGEPENIAIQKPDTLPSQYVARRAEWLLLPEVPDGQACPGSSSINVSDHCGVFVRFEHEGQDAGALRQVFVDAPDTVIGGERYRLQAVPSGGSDRLAFEWLPGPGTTARIDARAGAPGGAEAWRVNVTDLQTGIQRTAEARVTFTPDTRPCQLACGKQRDACLACKGPGCFLPRECVAEYRECVQACSYP